MCLCVLGQGGSCKGKNGNKVPQSQWLYHTIPTTLHFHLLFTLPLSGCFVSLSVGLGYHGNAALGSIGLQLTLNAGKKKCLGKLHLVIVMPRLLWLMIGPQC